MVSVDTTTPRKLGKSDLMVTPLGFGGGPFHDARIPNRVCLDAVKAAWDGGVRFFDTAPWYGIGRSERRLGMALAECGDRDLYAVNTKVGRTVEPEPEPIEANQTLTTKGRVRTPRDPLTGHRIHFEYTYDAFHSQVRDSMARMGMSRFDSLTIHDVDYGYHNAEQVKTILRQLAHDGGGGARALEEMRGQGRIKAIGLGLNREWLNHDTWDQQEDLVHRIADIVDLDFMIIAGPYTLLDTIAMRRVMPLCADRKIGVVMASPYAGGWLVAPDKVSYMYGETPEDVVDRSKRMQAICQSHNVRLAAVALQFVLAHPLVATVIPGTRSPEEASEAQEFLNEEVPAQLWSELKSEGLMDPEAPTPN